MIALELLLVAFVLVVGAFRLERLRTSLAIDPAALATWVRRHGPDGPARLAAAVAAEEGEGAVARLAGALAEPDGARRAAGCNEALVDLEPWLAPVDGDGALVRVLALGTLLVLALLVVTGQGTSPVMLDAIGLGAGAAVALVAMKRDGRVLERAWRQGLDRWVEASLEALGVEAARAVRTGRRPPSPPSLRPGGEERQTSSARAARERHRGGSP